MNSLNCIDIEKERLIPLNLETFFLNILSEYGQISTTLSNLTCSLTCLKPFKSMAADVYNFYFLGIKRVNLSGKNLREKNVLKLSNCKINKRQDLFQTRFTRHKPRLVEQYI